MAGLSTPTTFRAEPLAAILAFVDAQRGAFEVAVLDPDRGVGCHAGALVEIDGVRYVHRPLRAWLDLAERLNLRLATPVSRPPLIVLRFSRLEPEPEPEPEPDVTERYGTTSAFAQIAKLEDPRFVLDLREALARARLPRAARVLDLGVNTGDELALVYAAAPDATVVGIDHSASALAVAAARYPRFTAVCGDLNVVRELGARFDLVLSIATFQSPGVDDRALLRRAIQDHLTPAGAVILGIPNGRYVDGELAYGTRMRNFAQPELGLLVKDVAFYRKYLQQHHRQVFVTGKHYVFVTGAGTST